MKLSFEISPVSQMKITPKDVNHLKMLRMIIHYKLSQMVCNLMNLSQTYQDNYCSAFKH